MNLLCPICASPLSRETGCWRCPNQHSFDIARQGYVNLLPVNQKHSLHPGDTQLQVAARREFLDGGFYQPIARALMEAARARSIQGEILDVGCGEGYYSAQLAQALNLPLTGLDISKEAVRRAAGKYKGYQWLCATASHIPVPNGSAGLVMSLFALTVPQEFHRVLAPGGYFFQVLAESDHLLGLLLTALRLPELPGFTLEETVPVRFSFTVEGRQVHNLLAMTPHWFRISKEGAKRLEETPSLTDTASCVLSVFRRD